MVTYDLMTGALK